MATIGDLARLSNDDLVAWGRKFGSRSADDIRVALARYGVTPRSVDRDSPAEQAGKGGHADRGVATTEPDALTIKALGLQPRLDDTLRRLGLREVWQLCELSRAQLSSLPMVGPESARKIVGRLPVLA